MQLAGQLDRHRFASQLLADNPLGDPAERDILVYRPPGYDVRKRYPVIMILAGFGSTNHSLLNFEPFAPNLVERFDHLVRTGQSQEALLVMPDAINRYGGSQFLDSSATGKYQSYLADEVLDYVDSTYRTMAEPIGRAVVGRSSGGFGALRLGMDRPDKFAVIGSHAGDSAFELSIRPALLETAIALSHAGGLLPFIELFLRQPQRHSFTAMMVIAYAAAYAPRPAQAPPGFALPFDLNTGELIPSVWNDFLAHDPLTRLQHDPQTLSRAAFVFLDAGDGDEHGLQFGARRMAALLRIRGCNVLHEEFSGGHRGTSYRYDHSLPLLVAACRQN